MHGTLPNASTASVCGALPLLLKPAPSGLGRPMLLALFVPALLTLLAPFWLLLTHLASDPAARAVVADRPLVALQLGLGFLILIGIFGLPLAALARSVLQKRHVTIDAGGVHVSARGPLRSTSWIEPLSAYKGLARRVRSSHSGVFHELVLVHTRPSRSVVVLSGPQISQETIDFLAQSFNLAEIPSRDAASFWRSHGSARLREPQHGLKAAAA